MLSDTVYRKIAEEFIGDNENSVYTYKTGAQLVKFFNEYFNTNHSYGGGFPSRWFYVTENLKKLESVNKLNDFFSVILSGSYISNFEKISHVNIAEEMVFKMDRLNELLSNESIEIKHHNGKIFLVDSQQDLELIGSGGFADVYKIKSISKAKKILKFEEKIEKSSRSRFKREYEITKSLEDLHHVINVSNYNPSECSYEMDLANNSLYEFINENEINENNKLWIIHHIVETIQEVHFRGILHRDLTPNNILIVNDLVKVSDFGIGKKIEQEYSHNTMMTRNLGQLQYAAPEQLNQLKDAGTFSDVYSLGKLINFILTKDPSDIKHKLRNICRKATATNPENRYYDASELLKGIQRYLQQLRDKSAKESMEEKFKNPNLQVNEVICDYIINLTYDELDTFMEREVYSGRIIMKVMLQRPMIIEELMVNLHKMVYRNFDYEFSIYDRFANVAHFILINEDLDIGYDEQILAAEIIRFVAEDVNRFNVQKILNQLISSDTIDYNIKESLEN